jgi:dipeptidyl aminopeptidase/acylaminoacyl peptidase
MRKLMLGACAGLLLAAAGPATAAPTRPFSVQDMLAMQRISDPRVSPDGARVAFVVRSTDLEANKGRFDLWLAATDGSFVRRLTSHEASDQQPRWSTDGQTLYFVSTRSGSAQVWRMALVGGEAEQVTRLPLDVDALEVAPGGRALVFSMAVFPGKSADVTRAQLDEAEKAKASGKLYERLLFRHWDTWWDGTRNHLFAYDLETGKTTDLMRAMDADAPSRPFGGSEEYAVTPDGKTLVFSARDVGKEEAWSTNFDLFSVPLDGSTSPKRLTTNPAWDTQPRFAPDGKTLAYLAMSRPGYEADRFRLVLRDWPTGKERSLDVKFDDSPLGDRSPAELTWSADGRELYTTADHLGQKPVFTIDPQTGRATLLVGDGQSSNPQPAAGRILFARNSLLGPTELFTATRTGADVKRVTRLNDERVAATRFGQPEQFTFTGAKGDKVYAWLVKPADFNPLRKYPLAFLIHGGPQGSFGNDFHYRWNPQAYAGAGYVALMIDFHGSTGYGQAFTDAINNDWAGAPYEDLVKGFDAALAKYPFIDGSRACALGASYGGYMINWIAGQPFADRFKCLVSHDGNLDERAAYYMTEELWFPEWEHGGTPWANPEGYAKHNPTDHVAKWKTPMLVIHGGKDFRVVETQGMATFTALQRKGIPSKFLYFPDENHWVLKPHNSIQWHGAVLDWLGDWLKK